MQGLLGELVSTAHPRVSGENTVSGLPDDLQGGSSPRERGKPVPLAGEANHLGLIPA